MPINPNLLEHQRPLLSLQPLHTPFLIHKIPITPSSGLPRLFVLPCVSKHSSACDPILFPAILIVFVGRIHFVSRHSTTPLRPFCKHRLPILFFKMHVRILDQTLLLPSGRRESTNETSLRQAESQFSVPLIYRALPMPMAAKLGRNLMRSLS
jgi:hypothetical protein